MGFKVLLKDKREEWIDADTYGDDAGNDYVFRKGDKTVAKFPVNEVVGVIERDKPRISIA